MRLFLVNRKESPNLSQFIEATMRDGYVSPLGKGWEGDVGCARQ